MGRLDRIKQAQEASKQSSFHPIDLNEGNVEVIFNKCLATNDTPTENISRSILFSRTLGYKQDDEFVFSFDKNKLLANKQIINYLFGQLKNFHNKDKKCLLMKLFIIILIKNGQIANLLC